MFLCVASEGINTPFVLMSQFTSSFLLGLSIHIQTFPELSKHKYGGFPVKKFRHVVGCIDKCLVGWLFTIACIINDPQFEVGSQNIFPCGPEFKLFLNICICLLPTI